MSELQQNLVCFNTFGEDESWSLETYEKLDGYKVWRKILAGKLTQDEVIDEVKASGLRGRGGAGFPTGTQVELHAAQRAGAKYTWYAIPMRVSLEPVTIAKYCVTTRTA